MHGRLLRLGLVVVLTGSGLVLGAQSDTIDDLDRLTPAQLEQEIIDELDDLFAELGLNPNGLYADDRLEEAILLALSDEGDDDNEDDVDYDELEEEMEEAGTSVEDVVAGAVEEADRITYRHESPSSGIARVKSAGNTLLLSLVNFGGLGQSRNTARAGTAACESTKRLVSTALRRTYQSGCRF